ncbi:hypothetical protein CSPX01_13591 [Colletotrichum filicis]|nr:hypothetical protein CSPX01_13591 [Colletotrichum filicis]
MHPHLPHITPFTFSPGETTREQMEQGPASLLSSGGWSSRLVVHAGGERKGGRDGGGDGGQSSPKSAIRMSIFPSRVFGRTSGPHTTSTMLDTASRTNLTAVTDKPVWLLSLMRGALIRYAGKIEKREKARAGTPVQCKPACIQASHSI